MKVLPFLFVSDSEGSGEEDAEDEARDRARMEKSRVRCVDALEKHLTRDIKDGWENDVEFGAG